MAAEETRLQILRAAERLFAEHGVDAVSLRQVSVAAGQRNTSATQYHFQDKQGLVEAVLWRHSEAIQRQWEMTLDTLEGETISIPALVALLVRPLAAKLQDEDGGWEYVTLCVQLLAHPTMPLTQTRSATAAAPRRVMGRVIAETGIAPALVPLRALRVTSLIYQSIHTYGNLARRGVAPVSFDLFVSDLIDSVTAVFCQPPSDATRELLVV